LQIHTATIAEVLGSMVRRFAWKSIGTSFQDLPQNWQRIEAGSQWLRRGRLLLVVGLEVRLFVPDGIGMGIVRGAARLLPLATSDALQGLGVGLTAEHG